MLDPQQVRQFQQDGFLIVDDLLDQQQVDLLSRVMRADTQLAQQTASRSDGEGGAIELAVRNALPLDTIYAAIVRSRRLVEPTQDVLGGEVYHYHHKVIFKQPRSGGAWAWHQDYGYWYDNACLFPLLGSWLIAVDPHVRENGCLQVIRGSHLMGRVEHVPVGDQTGADPERVAVALERLEHVYVELQPGAAVLFHCNLLHRSDQNHSDQPRWSLICCYNAARNNPYRESRHPCYSHLDVWPHERIDHVGREQWAAIQAALS
jgi:ectoine hydroxylase-related dioxygenase (phytanoyl-CoA dioxygenase family)